MGNMAWWHWIVAGIFLILLELVVPSFTIFWFGLGALVTGVLLLMLPSVALQWQILVFLVSSIAFTVCWFRYFVPRKRMKDLLHDEHAAIGQTGISASRALTAGERGRVVFSVPVLGEESWFFIADVPVMTGDRLRVVAVLPVDQGDCLLKVEKVGA